MKHLSDEVDFTESGKVVELAFTSTSRCRSGFFYEKVDYKIKNPRKTVSWIIESARREKKIHADINYIFCSDSFLLALNQEFLSHKNANRHHHI